MWFKFIVIGVKAGEKGKTAQAFLKYKGNESPFHVPDQQLAAFCLPLGPESQSQKERMSHEEYTFTLTQGDGTRVQGFCRRFLPPAPRTGSKLRFPQVMCLVCEASWPTLFFKVLDVLEQLLRQTDLLLDFSRPELPAESSAGRFLSNLAEAVAQQPALGSVMRVQVPAMPDALSINPSKSTLNGFTRETVQPSSEMLELQVPPDCGNGTANAGISLARLLWHVPVPAMLTLIASLLLERRVLIVGQSRDMVSAAVAAAAALIYPFKWHHIFLPLLPRSFKDYLTAPMPFLIGMPAQLLPTLKGIPMDEVTLIDLDLGKCEPSSGSLRDDAAMLPWREQLEAALHAAFGMLRSPTEYESNPLITNIMQGYFLKLVGGYRNHVYPEGTGPSMPGWHPSNQAGSTPMRHSISAGSLNGLSSAREEHGRSFPSLPSPGRDGPASGRKTPAGGVAHDDTMKGHGYWFDHTGLVASHRRNERARSFLGMLRQSQMYEVFIQERLKMFATVDGGPEHSGDPFEQLVNYYLDNRSRKLAARLGAGVKSGLSRFTAFVKKHRRTGSNAPEGGGSSFASSFAGSSSGLLSSPEAQRIKQLAATFASAAVGVGQMRRSNTEGSNLAGLSAGTTAAVQSHRHTMSSIDGLADQIGSGLDPSAFFEDDEEELDAEAADAAAAMAGNPARQGFGSRNNSSSSLKDLLGSAASWTAGSANSSARSMRASASGALEQVSMQQQQPRPDPAPPLGRRSVPAAGLPASASGSAVGVEANTIRSPSPLLDVRYKHSSTGDMYNSPGSAPLVHSQQQSGHFLQQQQQQHMQRQQRPPRNSLSSIGEQTVGMSPRNDDLYGAGQQHYKPKSPAAGGAAVGQRALQHLHMKAALASITPGPLPQPPQPKGRTGGVLHSGSGSSHLLHSSGGSSHLGHGGSNSMSTKHPSYQQPPQQLSPRQQQQVTGASAAVWDPFLELAIERSACGVAATANAEQPDKCSNSSSHHDVAAFGSAAERSSTASSSARSSERASNHSSVGQQHNQQQQVGDLLDLEPRMPSFGGSDGFANLRQPVADSIVAVKQSADSEGVGIGVSDTSTTSKVGQLLQLDDPTQGLFDVQLGRSSGDGSSSSAAAPATPQIAAVHGTSAAGGHYRIAGSSGASSTTGDAGMLQLEELLMGPPVAVARSDSLLDM